MHALVTGANGHLGFNLVQALLARGDRVRAGVRSTADAGKCQALHALPGVEVVGADLGQPAQLRAAMDGIDTLFHVAAVYATTDPGRDAEILRAAIEGTESSLMAARDANVRRVVMTSSMVTLPLTAPGAPPATEADWTDDLRITYFRAKVESERLAWQLARELKLDLVTVLPGGIIGPGFRRNTPSIDIVQAALLGEFRFGVPLGNFPFIDVRDVVDVHLRVADRAIGGRFIAGPDVAPSFRQLVETLRRIDPRVPRPLMTLPRLATPMLPLYDALSHRLFGTPRIATPEVVGSAVSGKVWNGSSARAKAELGWMPRVSFEQSLAETLAVLR
jgi:dihydroflavonol-4-reductase